MQEINVRTKCPINDKLKLKRRERRVNPINMASLRWNLCFSLVLYGALLTNCHAGRQCLQENHVALFVFGDSLFEAGNNNYINTTADNLSNFGPYGMTTFKYPSGRFSDGRIVPDFIAEYANLPYIPPYLHPGSHHLLVYGANFASAGAAAQFGPLPVIHLQTQLRYFKNLAGQYRREFGDAEARKLLKRAVYLINIAANDYFEPSMWNNIRSQEYVDIVIGNMTIVLRGIYEQGGRKFAILGVPPLLSIPSSRKEPVSSQKNPIREKLVELLKLHDEALFRALQKLERQLHGFKHLKASLSTFLDERIYNPSKYGFKEGKMACCGTGPYRGINSCGGKRISLTDKYEVCGNPTEYVFFDSNHPSEKTHQQLAELMWSGSPNLVGPYNLKALFKF